MKIAKFSGGLLLAATVAPAHGQTVADDVRCLIISNVFAKGANTEQQRQSAAQSAFFFTGRITGRANPQQITAAIRAKMVGIDPKTAGQEMTACATRAAQAQQAIQTLGQGVVAANRK